MMNRLVKMTCIAACFFLTSMHLQAGNCEASHKVLTKNFPVSENATLKIDNFSGKIIISEWDKNEISFTVTITATAKKQSTAQGLVEKVVVDFKHEGNIVSAKTNCPSQKDKCNCTYSINYQISVPKNIHYDLKTKSGNIEMENATGNVTVFLERGDFSGNEFSGNSKINVSYGKLSVKKLSGANDELTLIGSCCAKKMSISEAKNLKINVKQSNLSIGTVEHLTIESTHTDVQITKAEKIQLHSQYGKYEIEELHDGTSISNLLCSAININKLTGKLSFLELSNSKITIHNVMPSFESITINKALCSSIEITLDAATSCKLESLVSYGNIQINAPKANISKLTSTNAESATGTFGNNETTKALIKIKSDRGVININQP